MYRRYTLKQPAARHARIGAFYAGILPVMIGFVVLSSSIGQEFSLDKTLNIPLAMAFILGTPTTAWLMQDAVKQRQRLTYWDVFEIMVIRATIVQLVFSLAFLIYFVFFTPFTLSFSKILSTGLTVQTIMWVVITLPLALVCAVIFKLSALRPIYG